MKLKAINYKLLRFLHLDQNDHLISLDRIKDVVFRAFLYMQLFHVLILIIIAIISNENKILFINASVFSFLLDTRKISYIWFILL